MLTDAQTDLLVDELHTRATAAGWADHVAENSRYWLKRAAVVVHVGPQVIALRTWTGAILQEWRDGIPALARAEFYGLDSEPVVDEYARSVAQNGDDEHDRSTQERREVCPDHGNDRVIGCGRCLLPVIQRVGPCECPRPWPWIGRGLTGRPNIRAITGQIDHREDCPGFETPTEAPREVLTAVPAEIVRPKSKKKTKNEIVSLELFEKRVVKEV